MLTIVIPALNAAATLGGCLKALDGAEDIIVVDGGSMDDTAEVARGAGATVIAAPRGRGLQLRAGAAAASGAWLLFLHADTRLGANWRAAVEHHIGTEPGKAACFRFALDDPAWQARLVELGVALRVRGLGLPYGDQGLLISRKLYAEVGGFRVMPLLEDVDLIRRVGRRRLSLLEVAALTSAERWRRDGWLRRTVRNLCCLLLYRLGVAPARIARLYG